MTGIRDFLARGELRYPRCRECGEVLAYAARSCRSGHRAIDWHVASGKATLRAVTTYRQAYSDAFPPPYSVGELELDEGPSIVALLDAGAQPPRIGTHLIARVSDGRLTFHAEGAAP